MPDFWTSTHEALDNRTTQQGTASTHVEMQKWYCGLTNRHGCFSSDIISLACQSVLPDQILRAFQAFQETK